MSIRRAKDDRLIHVKTSELVFLQKLGTAATDQDVEFEYNGMTGHAHGAEYNSDTGLLVLQSAVKMHGVKQGKPVVLTADHAELDRQQEQVLLTRAEYTVVNTAGWNAGDEGWQGDGLFAEGWVGGTRDGRGWSVADG